MTDALVLAVVAIVPTSLASVGTFYATRAALAKNKTEGDQGLIKILMEERRYLDSELRVRDEEIRKLRTDVQLLQERQKSLREQDDVLDELDKRIRHDGATLIRNLLTRAMDAGLDVGDLAESARALEKVRDMRREAAGQSVAAAMVPK